MGELPIMLRVTYHVVVLKSLRGSHIHSHVQVWVALDVRVHHPFPVGSVSWGRDSNGSDAIVCRCAALLRRWRARPERGPNAVCCAHLVVVLAVVAVQTSWVLSPGRRTGL
jgi:hypothetical protein